MPITSQNGECLVLTGIVGVLAGRLNQVAVEIGVNRGDKGILQSNTWHLARRGWKTILIDAVAVDSCIEAFRVTQENIAAMLHHFQVQRQFGVLSIDIDGMDYWIWRAIPHKPAIVIIEYNAQIDSTKSLVTPYDPEFRWDGTSWFGASAKAIVDLAHHKDYKLVCDVDHVNLVFVRADLLRPLYSPYPEPDLASLGGRIVGPDRFDPRCRAFVEPPPFDTSFPGDQL